MIRFDIPQETPQKPSALEYLHLFGGFYPFLPPLAWAIAPLYWRNVIRYIQAALPERWQFVDATYISICTIWFLGFAPLAWLCSVLYRRQGEKWWNRQRSYEAHRLAGRINLDTILQQNEKPWAALHLNTVAVGGGCPEDVVIVTSALVVSLTTLINIAVGTIALGPTGFFWVRGVGLAFVALLTVRALFAPPSLTVGSVSMMGLVLLFAIRQTLDAISIDLSELLPVWLLLLSFLPIAIWYIRRRISPHLHWLLVTDRRIIGLKAQREGWSDLRRSIAETGGWKLLAKRLRAGRWAEYKVSGEWPHGGTMTISRSRWSDVVRLPWPSHAPQSMYITNDDIAEIISFITERSLPWTISDQRNSRNEKLRVQASCWVDALVAIMIAVGAGRVCGPFCASTMTARYALLPTLNAAQRGDAWLYDKLLPRVLSARPRDPLVWCYRAMAAEMLGKIAEAHIAWQRALELTGGQGKVGRAAKPALMRLRKVNRSR